MNTRDLTDSLRTLFSELAHGAPGENAYMLNPGDPGLLRSLDSFPADSASAPRNGGSSIAAHVAHLRYGLSLLNRWAAGENPFADANWAAAWQKTTVSETEWVELRRALRAEVDRWLSALGTPREVNAIELHGLIGSIGHLAYHLGAIRQMDRGLRGPAARDG
jgi:hypothetical protein